MNIMVPHDASLFVSAFWLDGSRLNSQINEASVIASTIRKLEKNPELAGKLPWSRHPIVSMWVGRATAVEYFHDICLTEWLRRGGGGKRTFIQISDFPSLPAWFCERADVHAAYRSRLLFKGSVDAIVKTLEEAFKSPYHKWRKMFNLPPKNVVKHEHRAVMEGLVRDLGIKIYPNHYRQFGWTEPDDLEYVWIK